MQIIQEICKINRNGMGKKYGLIENVSYYANNVRLLKTLSNMYVTHSTSYFTNM